MTKPSAQQACPWPRTDLSVRYHDERWGVPLRDDRALFELLILEGAQAGLSWETVLAKRERYREVYHGSDPARIARFTPRDVQRLMNDPGIVRNRLKIVASIGNARAYLALMSGGVSARPGETAVPPGPGAFSRHLWSFVGGSPVINRWSSPGRVPASTPASAAMSRSLKRLGFRFVGSTICYAFMQAAGMVNDQLTTCPRHAACAALAGAGPGIRGAARAGARKAGRRGA
jgi:DNA-3-methyladenine glycosylase I